MTNYRDAACCATCAHGYLDQIAYEGDLYYCNHPESQSIIDQSPKTCYGVHTEAHKVCDAFLSQEDA